MKKRLLGGAYEYLIKGVVLLGTCLWVFVTDRQEADNIGYMSMAVFTVLGLGLLVWAGKIILANQRNYAQFFNQFPELNSQISALETRASFIDHQFGLLIYKGHLISYRVGQFTVVPLARVSRLSYYKVSGSLKRLPKVYLIADFLDGAKPVYLPIKALTLNSPKLWLEAVHHDILKDFPHITYH
ncbi:hypothetical protein ACVRZR_07415 [Streptococcus entericus]|uniref:hypothetical protein n=1 Tax=Streptococcus entericus TaxID=155680 RepID=UPI0003651FE8|nr:hypothetical protein [Streptococcus entericus]